MVMASSVLILLLSIWLWLSVCFDDLPIRHNLAERLGGCSSNIAVFIAQLILMCFATAN